MVNFFLHHQNRVKWILHVRHQVELVYEWRSSWLALFIIQIWDDHLCALSKIVPNNCSSMHWIVMLVRFVYGLVLYTIFIHPWFGRSFLRFHLVLSFRWTYLRFILRCFIFPLRKAYGRYILVTKDFICPCLFASHGSLWMNVQK